jgi:hypothetical protein
VHKGHLLPLQQTAHHIASVTLNARDIRSVRGGSNENLHDCDPSWIL